MRRDRRRWFAPFLAALVLLTGGVPASASSVPSARSAATVVGQDRPAPDDALRPAAAEQGERGGVTERSLPAALVLAGTGDAGTSTVGTGRPAAPVARRPYLTPNRPRAPPGSASPIPS